VLPAAALDDWGWRIAFLLGATTLPVGLWIRRNLPETLHAPDPAARPDDGRTALALARQNARIIVLALVVLSAGTIGTYTFSYFTTFAQQTLHMTPAASFLASSIGYFASVVACLAGGWLSDRYGRRPLMIWPGFIVVLVVLPVYYWIVHAHGVVALATGSVVLAVLGGLRGGAFYAAIAESLPRRIRGGVFAIVYASAIAVFGGTTQLVITWLIEVTGNAMAPAWYLFGALIGSQIAVMLIVESAPARAPRLAVPVS
jgi:MFS family permease